MGLVDAEDVDNFFLVITGIIIFFMQVGFAFLEAGSVRSKNTTTILLKNALDSSGSALFYWATGWAFGFGGSPGANQFIGERQFFLTETNVMQLPLVFFEFTFAATSATIVSGALAERSTSYSYLIYACFATGFVYPVVTHWVWSGDGWLTIQLGYVDFAGSSVVHIVGGAASLVGAVILGPRIGRFDENLRPRPIPGHSTVLTTLGYFALWFGFFAFNGGSVLHVSNGRSGSVGRACVNTLLSGAAAALSSIFAMKTGLAKDEVQIIRSKVTMWHPFGGHWSLIVLINGSLAGMVAICAGANSVEPWAATVIGLVAGVVYVASARLLEMAIIDDPLCATAVHLAGGIWGSIAVALFAHPNRLPMHPGGGVFYGWDANSFVFLGQNTLGAAVIFAWAAILTFLFFIVMRLSGHFRVTEEAEEDGLDFIEGEPAYPIDLAVFAE